MAEEHDDTPDGDDGASNPKTASQLKIAREDAKQARIERDRYRADLTALRSESTRTKTTLESQIEELKTSHATELEKVKIDLTGRATSAEAKAEQATANAQQRVMMSDLRGAAKDAGMVDMDGLKLLDLTTARLDAEGNLTNGEEMLAAMKEAKPYFFGTVPPPGPKTGTTTSTAIPPRQSAPAAFNARTATKEEYAAKRAEAVGTRAPYGGSSKSNYSVVP